MHPVAIDYSKFRSSLLRLEEQYENHLRPNPALSDLNREAIADSVVKRFEICYDCLWKVLKRHLAATVGLLEMPNSPKAIFRLAHDNHVAMAPLERWLAYADARTDTAHDYDRDKAQACLALTSNFLDDAIHLYETLTGAEWK